MTEEEIRICQAAWARSSSQIITPLSEVYWLAEIAAQLARWNEMNRVLFEPSCVPSAEMYGIAGQVAPAPSGTPTREEYERARELARKSRLDGEPKWGG